MSDTFQFLIVLSFAFLPVVIFAVIARGILRRLRNPEQLGRAMSMAIENELRKTGIDPGIDDFQTAISASGRSEKMATRFNRLAAQDLPPEVMKAIQKRCSGRCSVVQAPTRAIHDPKSPTDRSRRRPSTRLHARMDGSH